MKTDSYAFFFLFAMLASILSTNTEAQVAPAGYKEPVTLTAGGFASVFKPDYVPNKLLGVGAYADLNLFHGVGIEAEARWQRFHDFEGIRMDNYLIGPRFKVKHFWRAQPYLKLLGGFSNMTFENHDATGRFGTVAVGGGIDIRLAHRWTVRAVDFEYQEWPKFLGSSLSPYGANAGISYRIFSR